MPVTSLRTRALWAGLGVLAGSAILAIVAVLFEDALPYAEVLLGISVNSAVHALALLVAFFVRANHPRLGAWSIALLIASFLAWLVMSLISPIASGDTGVLLASAAATISTAGALTLHVGIVLIPSLEAPHWRILRGLTIVSAVLAAIAMVVLIFGADIFFLTNVLVPFFAVTLLLAMLGTAMIYIAASIERSSAADAHEHALPPSVPVSLTCPHCGGSITIASQAPASCTSCGLKIRVTIEEPRCACGYLLYNIEGDTCPECGSRVPAP